MTRTAMGVSPYDDAHYDAPIGNCTDAQRRAARITCAGHVPPADLPTVLAALGLDEDGAT